MDDLRVFTHIPSRQDGRNGRSVTFSPTFFRRVRPPIGFEEVLVENEAELLGFDWSS